MIAQHHRRKEDHQCTGDRDDHAVVDDIERELLGRARRDIPDIEDGRYDAAGDDRAAEPALLGPAARRAERKEQHEHTGAQQDEVIAEIAVADAQKGIAGDVLHGHGFDHADDHPELEHDHHDRHINACAHVLVIEVIPDILTLLIQPEPAQDGFSGLFHNVHLTFGGSIGLRFVGAQNAPLSV